MAIKRKTPPVDPKKDKDSSKRRPKRNKPSPTSSPPLGSDPSSTLPSAQNAHHSLPSSSATAPSKPRHRGPKSPHDSKFLNKLVDKPRSSLSKALAARAASAAGTPSEGPLDLFAPHRQPGPKTLKPFKTTRGVDRPLPNASSLDPAHEKAAGSESQSHPAIMSTGRSSHDASDGISSPYTQFQKKQSQGTALRQAESALRQPGPFRHESTLTDENFHPASALENLSTDQSLPPETTVFAPAHPHGPAKPDLPEPKARKRPSFRGFVENGKTFTHHTSAGTGGPDPLRAVCDQESALFTECQAHMGKPLSHGSPSSGEQALDEQVTQQVDYQRRRDLMRRMSEIDDADAEEVDRFLLVVERPRSTTHQSDDPKSEWLPHEDGTRAQEAVHDTTTGADHTETKAGTDYEETEQMTFCRRDSETSLATAQEQSSDLPQATPPQADRPDSSTSSLSSPSSSPSSSSFPSPSSLHEKADPFRPSSVSGPYIPQDSENDPWLAARSRLPRPHAHAPDLYDDRRRAAPYRPSLNAFPVALTFPTPLSTRSTAGMGAFRTHTKPTHLLKGSARATRIPTFPHSSSLSRSTQSSREVTAPSPTAPSLLRGKLLLSAARVGDSENRVTAKPMQCVHDRQQTAYLQELLRHMQAGPFGDAAARHNTMDAAYQAPLGWRAMDGLPHPIHTVRQGAGAEASKNNLWKVTEHFRQREKDVASRMGPSSAKAREYAQLRAKRAAEQRRRQGVLGRPPFPAHLTDEQEAQLQKAWQQRDFVVSIPGACAAHRDLVKLRPRSWLNDETINFYGQLVLQRSQRALALRRDPTVRAPQETLDPAACWDVHVFNSFFYHKLATAGHAGVARWTRRVDVFGKDKILFPVNLGNTHWVTGCIDFRRKRVEYYDSMRLPNPAFFQQVAAWLQAEHEAKCHRPLDWEADGWTEYSCTHFPSQQNGYDCGVFTIAAIEQLSRRNPLDPYPASAAGRDAREEQQEQDEPFNFSGKDMPYLRRRFAYEIITKHLLDS